MRPTELAIPAAPPHQHNTTKEAQKNWASEVAMVLRKRPGVKHIIRRYKSPTGAWTARAKWAPLMPGVQWRAVKEKTDEGHQSALYAWWPARG